MCWTPTGVSLALNSSRVSTTLGAQNAMRREDKTRILEVVEELKFGNPNLGYGYARDLSRRVLQPLLAEDGYHISYAGRHSDLLATRQPSDKHEGQTIAITFKFWESD